MCLNRITNIAKLVFVAGIVFATNNILAQEPAKNPPLSAPKLLLTGKITDASTKKAIAGASVSVRDFSAAITDDKGNFSLN